jgi:hypothetical protein
MIGQFYHGALTISHEQARAIAIRLPKKNRRFVRNPGLFWVKKATGLKTSDILRSGFARKKFPDLSRKTQAE